MGCIGKIAEMRKNFKSLGDEVEIAGLLQVNTIVSTEYAKYIYLVENTHI